jgi:hypothetical protein
MSAKSAQTVGATTRSFNTRIFDRGAQGCDFLHTDENGLIDEFTVMVRPLSAALALAEAMKVQLEAAPRDQRHAGVLVARGSATRANQTRGWMERRVRRGRAATSVEPPARPAPGRRPSTPPRGRIHMKAESRSGRGLRADYWSVRNGAARRCRRLAAAPRQERSCARRRPGRCFWCNAAAPARLHGRRAGRPLSCGGRPRAGARIAMERAVGLPESARLLRRRCDRPDVARPAPQRASAIAQTRKARVARGCTRADQRQAPAARHRHRKAQSSKSGSSQESGAMRGGHVVGRASS